MHWADEPSVRFLLHLARRLDGLSVAVLLAIRTSEAGTDPELARRLALEARRPALHPRPLSSTAVQRLIRTELGERAIRRRIASFYFDLAFGWFAKGETANARICLRRALRAWPTNHRYWMLYAASLLGPTRGTAVRRAWRRLRGRNPEPSAELRLTG